MREEFPDVVDAEPELIAHHFTQAGLTELAIEYWGKAGDLALRRSAFKEAIAHLGKAIEMTEALQGAGETDKTGANSCGRRKFLPSSTSSRKQCSTPILLTHTPARCRVIPVAGIKLGIGRRLCVASDAEQRTEGVERVEAPVEPKREFVEVGL